MKLKNKKTGEIIEWEKPISYKLGKEYGSLADLNAEWEDAPEEPKKHYEILGTGVVVECINGEDDDLRCMLLREIGNYFESEEEANRTVKKLKAWKRLKDKGFRFNGWTIDDELRISIRTNMDSEDVPDDIKEELSSDLDTCFGGEE